jgi:hypothetical protein
MADVSGPLASSLRPSYPVRSERLLLRPLAMGDADALLAYRSREDVCRYVPFEPMRLPHQAAASFRTSPRVLGWLRRVQAQAEDAASVALSASSKQSGLRGARRQQSLRLSPFEWRFQQCWVR